MLHLHCLPHLHCLLHLHCLPHLHCLLHLHCLPHLHTFGLSAYDPELTFGENFASADRALYHGKETGKNRCVFAQSNQIERDGGNRS